MRRADRVLGPFPTALVRRFVLHGRIVASDELSSDRENWAQARTLRQLLPRELAVLNPKVSATLFKGSGAQRRSMPATPPASSDTATTARQSQSAFSHYAPRMLGLLLVVGALGGVVSYLSNGEGDDKPDCELAAAAGVNWRSCQKGGTMLRGSDLRQASMRNIDLSRAQLERANLSGADLAYAKLEQATLRGTELGGATLTGANLRGADLRDATLAQADLSYADLTGASLAGANLAGARLGKAIWTDGRECRADAVGQC